MLYFCILKSAAQHSELDSLQQVAKTATGSELMDAYQAIAEYYYRDYFNILNIDSAEKYVQRAYRQSIQQDYLSRAAYALGLLAKTEAKQDREERSFTYMKEAVALALQSEDSACIAKTYEAYTFLYYIVRPDPFQQLHYAHLALRYAEGTYDHNELSDLLITVAMLVEDTGNYEGAMTYYARALNQLNAGRLSAEVQMRLYSSLGNYYYRLEEPKKALDYMRQALRISQETHNIRQQHVALGNMGLVYYQTGDYVQAENLLIRAYQISDSINNETDASMNALNLGIVYDALGDYERAERFLQVGVERAKANDDLISTAYGYLYLGGLALNQKNLLASEAWLEQAQTLSEKTLDKEFMLDLYKTKTSVDSAQGDFKNAYFNHLHYVSYKDSIMNQEKREAISRLEIEYETAQKDNEIDLLKTQNELQILKEEQMAQHQFALIVGSVLLLCLLGITFNRYRLKQQAVSIIQIQKQAIEEKNAENELLIREIHHRVKNNLQIILSLLNTQANVLSDPQAVAIITESQNRVRSVALIHEKLYKTNNFTQVPVQSYLSEMAHRVVRSYQRPVQLRLAIESLDIGISTAVPLGLIVTELLTNACKYACHGHRPATLSISFKKVELGSYCLQVGDNGPGLPPDFDIEHARSFGLRLVNGLTRQLHGELRVESQAGVYFEIIFPEAV